MATARVLCIGTELTRGEVTDTNSGTLAARLTALGFRVVGFTTVDDDPERIRRALREASDADVLVATGGLGPTTDDLTTACVAAELGIPLERDPASLEALRARFERFKRPLTPSNEKQADFPRGARVLPNPNGTAPGFSLRLGRALAFFMPGVPSEMRAMFDASVAPSIRDLPEEAIHQIQLRTFGLPESTVNDKLAGIERAHGVTLGYRAASAIIDVKVLAVDRERVKAEARARQAADEVAARLGPEVVFAEGDVTLAEAVGRLLLERGLTIATAESCTGGLVGELLTARAGASAFYQGGLVTYANSAKTRLLGVEPALLEAHGAVSREVARAMAEGARTRLDADVALAITGIAGPDGGSAEKPVGLVHYAVATRAGTLDAQSLFPGEREAVRLRAAHAALALVRRVLRDPPNA